MGPTQRREEARRLFATHHALRTSHSTDRRSFVVRIAGDQQLSGSEDEARLRCTSIR